MTATIEINLSESLGLEDLESLNDTCTETGLPLNQVVTRSLKEGLRLFRERRGLPIKSTPTQEGK